MKEEKDHSDKRNGQAMPLAEADHQRQDIQTFEKIIFTLVVKPTTYLIPYIYKITS